tara:strand:+ start:232 stop:1098 length:867 start_codon:yes stop_codon:yes gene_type:complete
MTIQTKKPETNDFYANIQAYKVCTTDVKNLWKVSETIEKTGFLAIQPLSLKVVSFYNEVKTHCESNKLLITDYFNLTKIRAKLYDLVNYPNEKDADGKPIRNYIFENLVSRAVKLALVLINTDKTKAVIKDKLVVAQSNVIYPDLKVSGNNEIKYTPNNDESLIPLSTRGLELLWNTISPKDSKGADTKLDENVLSNLKTMKNFLNAEMQNRNKKADYLVNDYGVSEIAELRKIAQFSLRLVEQYERDQKDFDKNGSMKNANIVNIESVEFKVIDHNKQSLVRVSKIA